MEHWVATIGIAFVLVTLAMAALGIGWLITGKNRLKKGCGPGKTVKKCEDEDKDEHS
jgi:hypothetical protein